MGGSTLAPTKRKTTTSENIEESKWHPRFRGRYEKKVVLESSDEKLFEVEWRLLSGRSVASIAQGLRSCLQLDSDVFKDMEAVATDTSNPIPIDLESRHLATLLDLLASPTELMTVNGVDDESFQAIAGAIFKYEFTVLDNMLQARTTKLLECPLHALRFASSLNMRGLAVRALCAMNGPTLLADFPTVDRLFEQLAGIRAEWQIELLRLLLSSNEDRSLHHIWNPHQRLDGATFDPDARMRSAANLPRPTRVTLPLTPSATRVCPGSVREETPSEASVDSLFEELFPGSPLGLHETPVPFGCSHLLQ